MSYSDQTHLYSTKISASVEMLGLFSSGALGGVEVLDGGLVGGELGHVLSAQAAAHAAATAHHQQQQIAAQQISEFLEY